MSVLYKNWFVYNVIGHPLMQMFNHGRTVDEIREIIGADSLTFLSVEGMLKALGREESGGINGSCLACFTGQYPTEFYPVKTSVKEKV